MVHCNIIRETALLQSACILCLFDHEDRSAAFKFTDRWIKGPALQISGDPPMRLLLTFQKAFPQSNPDWVLQAPGRDIWVAACLGQDSLFNLVAPDLDSHTSFNYRSAKTYSTVLNRPLPPWARYPAGVLMLLREMGLELSGLQVVLAGREPAGPRYHYALGIAVAGLCYESQGQDYSAEDLIDLVEQARRVYVDV